MCTEIRPETCTCQCSQPPLTLELCRGVIFGCSATQKLLKLHNWPVDFYYDGTEIKKNIA